MSKVFVIGGGAAGMFAAVFASRAGNEVHIFEKNEKFGKKIYITGKGRCNITNACDMEELLQSVRSNAKFLYSAFYGYTNHDVIDFFEQSGCKTKIERGNRVFPVSDHSSDVISALVSQMKKSGVITHLNSNIKSIICDENGTRGIKKSDGTTLYADKLIVATGGLSYPSTGSTGDGYQFARQLGITVTNTMPSLVPLEIEENYVKELQGLSLKNVEVTIYQKTLMQKDGNSSEKSKKIYQAFGEMLFTHFGVSGPLILSGSSYVAEAIQKNTARKAQKAVIFQLSLDLKPALTEKQLEQRILRDFETYKNKQFKNVLSGLFPSKLIPVMVELSRIPGEQKIHDITKEERNYFVYLIKNLTMTISGMRSFHEAVITKGGISVKEINPSTMESKRYPDLFFAGEVLDLDAVTGGFNLQIAWSTGFAAGSSV